MSEVRSSLHTAFIAGFPADAAGVVETLDAAEQRELLDALPAELVAGLLRHMSTLWSAAALEALPAALRSAALAHLPAVHAARMLGPMTRERRREVLSGLPTAAARDIALYLGFPSDSVGAYMSPAPFALVGDVQVADAVLAIRDHAPRHIQEVYVTDRGQRLIGKVSLRSLLLASPQSTLHAEMDAEALAINPMENRDAIFELIERSGLLAIPVTDLDGVLLGEVRTEQILQAKQEDTTGDMLKMVGASEDERVHSRVLFSVRKRLPWLEINLATAFLAAAVVGLFQDTLARFTALAVLLPVVAGQSGNAGAQSLAVVMRGLALRDVRPSQWLFIGGKELAVGMLNGVAIAVTTCAGVYLWSGNLGLTAVMGLSMVIAMTAAALSGAMIPVLLRLLNQDPAQSSSILLTTVTDVVGFMSFLGLATYFASWLE